MISAGTLAPRCSRRSSWRRNDYVFEETNLFKETDDEDEDGDGIGNADG